MARYPVAAWRPLPETNTQARITPTQLILHTAACRCGDSLHDDFNRPGNNLESHFYVQLDGGVEQYVDTEVRADANYRANVRAISVETEDGGDSTRPWTVGQVEAIVALIVWAIRTHPGITPVVCPAWDKPGLGYHTLFGSPSPWTPVAKSCPGPARKAQFPSIVRQAQAALRPAPPVAEPVAPPGILDSDMTFFAWDKTTGKGYLVDSNTKVYVGDPDDAGALINGLGLKTVHLTTGLLATIPDAE